MERVGVRIVLALLLLFPSVLHAAFSSKSAGTSGAAFLKIGAGARPTAMGGAYTAIADDVNAINWNAAGLSLIKEKNEFVAMRAELFQEIQYNFFAFAHPMGDYGTIGVGLANLNITGIEQRSADSDTPDSTFAANDSAYTLAYGRKLFMDNLHLGIAGKAIRQTLAGEAANTFAADLGALYQFPDKPLTAGLAIQNLGAKQKFKSEADPLPLTIKAGSSYRIGQDWQVSGVSTEQNKTGLLMALDLHSPRDNDPSIRTGAEFTHGWSELTLTSVRAGYETGRNRQVEGMGSGVSAGAGVTYKFFTFDFAWVPYGNLGNTFRYSIKLRF
ncbi:MAG: hypothetical protein A3A86_06080 [Elusimicrobia bacterium RIFCSPLOWO2_01_FULL_60_11]|nr:MAG: hypothetical protein A3A86_06080 [Elusimicrobia bacterium RIFCSPLOWO2_01_FULL_60_11]